MAITERPIDDARDLFDAVDALLADADPTTTAVLRLRASGLFRATVAVALGLPLHRVDHVTRQAVDAVGAESASELLTAAAGKVLGGGVGRALLPVPGVTDEAGVRARVRTLLDHNWTKHGYTVAHSERYPHQWLWDSCFHAVIWADLGDERAVEELASVFRHQAPSGFVPHMTYDSGPHLDAQLWRRHRTSSITQPPMYGHAAAELIRRGFDVPEQILDAARRGLRFLLRTRRPNGGLVTIVHPWESGADDSPRWDDWFEPQWDRAVWHRRKGELLTTVEHAEDGSPIGNPAFSVASVGFNALVAFNALELSSVIDDDGLASEAQSIADALAPRWCDGLRTWTDDPVVGSGTIRTLDALLPHLVIDRPLSDELVDPRGYGTPNGPAGVHVDEPSYDPAGYWRGSSWPHLTYLLILAAMRRGQPELAERLRQQLRTGALCSQFAEHWHAESGVPLGAVAQSWSGLTIIEPPDPVAVSDSPTR